MPFSPTHLVKFPGDTAYTPIALKDPPDTGDVIVSGGPNQGTYQGAVYVDSQGNEIIVAPGPPGGGVIAQKDDDEDGEGEGDTTDDVVPIE